ncbi:hypothetical protein FRC10_006048 [Ceratobasidium sp. 414]|nr:hypothetical protein FRC10_006048 [Ceratobasidium sp. 414]
MANSATSGPALLPWGGVCASPHYLRHDLRAALIATNAQVSPHAQCAIIPLANRSPPALPHWSPAPRCPSGGHDASTPPLTVPFVHGAALVLARTHVPATFLIYSLARPLLDACTPSAAVSRSLALALALARTCGGANAVSLARPARRATSHPHLSSLVRVLVPNARVPRAPAHSRLRLCLCSRSRSPPRSLAILTPFGALTPTLAHGVCPLLPLRPRCPRLPIGARLPTPEAGQAFAPALAQQRGMAERAYE